MFLFLLSHVMIGNSADFLIFLLYQVSSGFTRCKPGFRKMIAFSGPMAPFFGRQRGNVFIHLSDTVE